MEKKVKPCPFCGSDNVYVTFEHGYLDDSAIVFCNACKVSVKLEDNDQEGFNDATAKRAVEAWNRRAERIFSPVMPITNADGIRTMSDDELASWIADIAMCNNCRAKNMDAAKPCKGLYDGCKGNWLYWLKQETERIEE